MHRYIFLIIILHAAISGSAQNYNNNNTNAPATGNTNKTLINQQDTISSTSPSLEELQISTKKSKTYRSVPNPKFGEEAEKADKDSNSSIQQLKSAKYQFETNYSDSRHQLTRRSASQEELLNMKQSAKIYADMLPGSFEKHFYTYLLNKYNPKQFPELQLAAKLEPTNTEVQQELAAYGVAVNDQELADSVAVQMIAQNKISGGLLDYAADMVNSIPENGTLLLHGYTELIPVNYEKNNLGRADIQLISVDLMQSPDYQASLTAKGFVMPNSVFVDTAFVQTFCALNTSRNLFLSMSFPKEYFQGITSALNPVGLTFAYGQAATLDYNTRNIALVETKWKKYELGIGKDPQSDALSANYLPVLLSVSRLYEEYNKTEEAKEIEHIIMSVATRARKTGQLSKIKR